MAVEPGMASLCEKLKVEGPWLPPRPWESIPSESGASRSGVASSSTPPPESRLFDASTVSEASLVRLALNALQGLESAVIGTEKLSAAFCSDPADRTSHRINGLWSRSSSTHALGRILRSIGFYGYIVLLLRKFVDYFVKLSLEGRLNALGNEGDTPVQAWKEEHLPFGLVNQAFAGAVNKVLEGYACALDTLYASAGLRRSSDAVSLSPDVPYQTGSLTSVVHSKITLLEVYLHTRELRTQIEALGSICNLQNVALGFSLSSFEELTAKAVEQITNFPKGSDLLSYLHEQLQAADPAHRALLKFLFVRSCEPYVGFIRSWIFKAEINDPYREFMVENVFDSGDGHSLGEAGCLPGARVQIRNEVSAPSFLKDFLVPIVRAGQQLQVVIKLFEFCNYVAPGINTYDEFLPCWKGFSDPSHTSPLSFSKVNIEELVLARTNYYNKMQEKLGEISSKLEFTYHQVGSWGTGHFMPENFYGSVDVLSSMLSDSPVAPPIADRKGVDNMDSDSSTSACEEDLFDLSDCSTSDCSDEQIEFKELIELPKDSSCLEDKYLSTLRFSRSALQDNSVEGDQIPCRKKVSVFEISGSPDILDTAGPSHSDVASSYRSISMECRWPTQSCAVLQRGNTWLKPSHFDLDRSNREMEVSEENKCSTEMGPPRPFIKDGILLKDDLDRDANTSRSSRFQGFRDLNFLSKNPMFSIKALTHSMGKPGTSCFNAYAKSLPCFEFSSVEDAVKVCVGKLDDGCIREPEYESSVKGNSDTVLVKKSDALAPRTDVVRKQLYKEDAICADVSGGSSWESLLATTRNPVYKGAHRRRETSSDSFEIPLDFIVEKCLLQEIWLQYKYVSKLTIKLLEDGFDLQEHLLTLRRYHFMGVADWADLFIMSLWHQKSKRFFTESEQRASDIQGLLETSIQRSSCESDNYKDRLFVYFDEHDTMPLSTSGTGIHSFDFLRLGYRVNWPVTIVLTPSSLKIYAEIFNFLIKVKLAIFALTDLWCLLKALDHPKAENRDSQLHGLEAKHVKTLINIRHHLNHFISMLQQYVQSQLSHVSWSTFLQSLKHKVKDMMDLESVHMAYLTDSLHICFLSEETQAIGSIIKNVLQYALDFRGCLVGGVHNTGAQADLLDKVQTIKHKFDKSREELQRIYRRSPKHGRFGISHFWSFLNYNEYYTNKCDQNDFFS